MIVTCPWSAQQLERWLVDWLTKRIGGTAPIAPNASFASLGLSSTEAVSLAGELETLLGTVLDPTLAYDHPTPRLLAQALATSGANTSAPSHTWVASPEATDTVAVVGMACRFPGDANTLEKYWALLCGEREAVTRVPEERWNAADYYSADRSAPGKAYTDAGAFVPGIADWDAAFFGLSPREAMRLDPQHRLLMEVVWEAIEDGAVSPEQLRGSRTALMVGLMGSDQYAQVQLEADGARCFDDPYFGLGASPSAAAGRIAHFLDLRGPCATVDTACSSGALAVHLAAQSLARGECDIALAAASSAMLHPMGFVQACAMGMLASDGRCKVFDESADGFTMGEGAGALVLARLSVAVAHGLPVRAVLAGSATNQDGHSNGLTAPSRQAQVDVIRCALKTAGVAPDDVDYVEAHGSGTSLGDAIEYGALKDVFAECDPRRPLFVGAAKSRTGHLLAAAGMAGLIKAVLVLERGVLPANANISRFSPALGLDERIVPPLRPATLVPPGSRPLTVGVSSFGWSGTNVHLVLHQAPEPEHSTHAERAQILPLSAREATALRAAAANLAKHVSGNKATQLVDVAATLQQGRTRMPVRKAVVATDAEDAARALTAMSTIDVPGFSHRAEEKTDIALLLPGIGDLTPGMGRELYETEAVFRDRVERCAAVVLAESGLDVREVLGLTGAPAQPDQTGPVLAGLLGRSRGPGKDSELTDRAEASHPAAFTLQYALAGLLEHWGIRPSVLLGYSLGEYVAACLAGVFTLEDALRVVIGRAQLIAAAPPGAMVAVATPATDLPPKVLSGVDIAALNGPGMTVLSGSPEAIDRATGELARLGLPHHPLATVHPFHSSLLKSVGDELAELVASVARREPRIRIVSNVTGRVLGARQAMDPRYWAVHLSSPVLFWDGLHEVATAASALLEVGPGATLSGLARHAPGLPPAIATMRTLGDLRGDREILLHAVARLWEQGVEPDWPAVTGGGRLVSLPTYPFQRTRYWPERSAQRTRLLTTSGHGERSELADWCHVPVWRQCRAFRTVAQQGRLLVFAHPGDGADTMATRARAEGQDVLVVYPEPGLDLPRRGGARRWGIDPENADHYQDVLATADAERVLFAWAVDLPADSAKGVAERQFHALRLLATSLQRATPGKRVDVFVALRGITDLTSGQVGAPLGATLAGLARALPDEYPSVRARCVDIGLPGDADEDAGVLAREVDLPSTDVESLIVHAAGQRWRQDWERLPLEPTAWQQVWREGGTYLITGGTGGLGLALARRLATEVSARLVLVGRNGVSERVRAEIHRLESAGAEVLTLAADVSDADGMRRILSAAANRFGPIHGVVHAAGVPGGGLLQTTTTQQAEAVLAPKVRGTLNLVSALAEQPEPLDFLVLYSSAVTALGGLGETTYAAANAFLDACADTGFGKLLPGTRVLSVAWGPWRHDSWQSAAFAGSPGLAEHVRHYRDMYGIGDDEGPEVLTRLLATGVSRALVVPQGLDAARKEWARLADAGTIVDSGHPGTRYPRPDLRTEFVAPGTDLERRIAEIWQESLGLDRVGVHDAFFELGGGSLLAIAVMNRLAAATGVELAPATLFERPTIAELAELLEAAHVPAHPATAEQARARGRRRSYSVGRKPRDSQEGR